MGTTRNRSRTGQQGLAGALPHAIVQTLRYPEPVAADFTPTWFCPAATKAWFAGHMLRFCSADFPQHHFTHRFYAQLMHCWGHIAHYNRAGFWEEFFVSTAGKVEFLEQTTAWPGYGSPEHTWCDVERAVNRRLRASDLLGHYRRCLSAERIAAERAELARLRAKYEDVTPTVDAGVLGTVTAATSVPSRDRPARGPGSGAQLTLGLG